MATLTTPTSGSSPKSTPSGAADVRPPTTLSRLGGVAALLVVAMLTVGALSPAIPLPGLGLRNWLVVLFQINSGLGQLPADPLHLRNPFDFAVLVLIGVAFASLWRPPGRVSRILWAIAVGLPFLGILVLLVTSLWGRSAVMGAGLVVAFLTFKSGWLKRAVVYLGALANAVLLVGDFATGTSAKPVNAVVLAVGYVLLTVWLAVVGVKMLRTSAVAPTAG